MNRKETKLEILEANKEEGGKFFLQNANIDAFAKESKRAHKTVKQFAKINKAMSLISLEND